ncbi:MAG: serine hydrolase domain-containing protein [Longimicrobiales bacterium]
MSRAGRPTARERRSGPLAPGLLALGLAALGVVLPGRLVAQDARFDSARARILRVLEEESLPSLAVAVAEDGRIVWEAGFGWADRERRIPATEHTMYSLASISKPITATGLMTLVEDGRIDLDRPANDYLGPGRLTGLAGPASAATVRRVLSHTAGLPLHYEFFYENEDHAERSMDVAIARYGILVNPPGEVYQYSNLGFGIIDHIIARVSGRSYPEFMRAEVFDPLGMTRSSVHVGPGLAPYAAQRYDSELRPIPYYDFDHDGGSAVYSSAHDLVRFGMFHLKDRLHTQRRILEDATIDAMQRVHTPGPTDSGYGLGWGIDADVFGFRRVAHSGGMPGVSTALHLYPDEDVAVVVLTNRGAGGAVYRIAEDLAAAVLPGFAAALREARSRRAGQTRAADDDRHGFEPPAELIGEWTGALRTYEGETPIEIVVQPDGDVHVTLEGELRALLNDVAYEDGNLTGRFAGTIPSADARRHPHTIRLDLRLREDGVLSGQASAQTVRPPIYFALTSYVELRRER